MRLVRPGVSNMAGWRRVTCVIRDHESRSRFLQRNSVP